MRKEAMRPFSSVDPTLHGSLLDGDGLKAVCRVLGVTRSTAYY